MTTASISINRSTLFRNAWLATHDQVRIRGDKRPLRTIFADQLKVAWTFAKMLAAQQAQRVAIVAQPKPAKVAEDMERVHRVMAGQEALPARELVGPATASWARRGQSALSLRY